MDTHACTARLLDVLVAPLPICYLIRGLPGTHRKECAQERFGVPAERIFAADDWFRDLATARGEEGGYTFDARLLPLAHRDCIRRVARALQTGQPVAVTNTFSRYGEALPYIRLCKLLDYAHEVVDLFDEGKSDQALVESLDFVLDVSVVARMRARWQSSKQR